MITLVFSGKVGSLKNLFNGMKNISCGHSKGSPLKALNPRKIGYSSRGTFRTRFRFNRMKPCQKKTASVTVVEGNKQHYGIAITSVDRSSSWR